MIECIWSPNIILYEKKINRKNLYDQKFEMFERAATFDGDEVFSNLAFVKGTGLSFKLRVAVDEITEVK